VVVYLNLAVIFAPACDLIWELNPAGFSHLISPTGAPGRSHDDAIFQFYYSDHDQGYGDFVPIDTLARGRANLESVVGQFYLAVTIARLVALEIADRRQ
jgi:hypothetical protein